MLKQAFSGGAGRFYRAPQYAVLFTQHNTNLNPIVTAVIPASDHSRVLQRLMPVTSPKETIAKIAIGSRQFERNRCLNSNCQWNELACWPNMKNIRLDP